MSRKRTIGIIDEEDLKEILNEEDLSDTLKKQLGEYTKVSEEDKPPKNTHTLDVEIRFLKDEINKIKRELNDQKMLVQRASRLVDKNDE